MILRNLLRVAFGNEPVLIKSVYSINPSEIGRSTVYGVDKDGWYYRVPDRKHRLIKFDRDPPPLRFPSMQGHINMEYYTGTLLEWRPVRSKNVPEDVKKALKNPDHNPFYYIEATDPCTSIF